MSVRGARYAAMQLGLKTYISGSACKNGHTSERITATGSCRECLRVNEKLRYYKDSEKTKLKIKLKYAANAEVIRARRREFHHKHKDILNPEAAIRSAEWRKNNPNHAGSIIAKRKWALANPEYSRASTIKRRVSKMNRTPKWVDVDAEWLMREFYGLAQMRSKLFGFKWHVDHIIPLQGKLVSGLHVPENLQVIPWIINIKKANRFTVI